MPTLDPQATAMTAGSPQLRIVQQLGEPESQLVHGLTQEARALMGHELGDAPDGSGHHGQAPRGGLDQGHGHPLGS